MNEELKKFLKSIGVDVDNPEDKGEEQSDLVKFAKGAIGAGDLTVSGNISPTHATKFIDLISQNSDFLAKTTVIPMMSLKTTYDVWEIARGILVRVAEGSEPTAAQKKKLENAGRELDTKPMQLFADVLKSTLVNNQHRPNLTSWLNRKFATTFSNEITYLGFIGEADTYASGAFKNLNKGWIAVAKAETNSKKETYAESDSMVKRLTKLVSNADDSMGDDAKILMHKKDFLTYCLEMGESTNTPALIMQAAASGFGGYAFELTNDIPKGTYVLTPLKNLVTGISMEISRARTYHERKRALEYTFDIYVDYDVAVPKLVSIIESA